MRTPALAILEDIIERRDREREVRERRMMQLKRSTVVMWGLWVISFLSLLWE
jgi:hypothetical protein